MALGVAAMRAVTSAAIRGESKSVAALQRLSAQIRGDIWNRYMATAQKRALIWWRDRSVSPGLKARFTVSGASYYGFGKRLRKPSSLRPYYNVTGALERALLARKPKTKQASKNGGIVQTILNFGGLSLNLMTTTAKPDMRGIVGWTRETKTKTESFNIAAYTRPWRRGSSTIVSVPAHSMTRVRTYNRHKPVRGGETHAALFGKFHRDAPVIQARVQVELRRSPTTSAPAYSNPQ
jgi:hypothetical protein